MAVTLPAATVTGGNGLSKTVEGELEGREVDLESPFRRSRSGEERRLDEAVPAMATGGAGERAAEVWFGESDP